jgi:hypothetical protein
MEGSHATPEEMNLTEKEKIKLEEKEKRDSENKRHLLDLEEAIGKEEAAIKKEEEREQDGSLHAKKRQIKWEILDEVVRNLRNDEVNAKKAIFLTQRAMGRVKSAYDFDAGVMSKRFKFHWLNLIKTRADSRSENKITVLDSAKGKRFLDYFHEGIKNPYDVSSSSSEKNKKRVKIWGEQKIKNHSARAQLLSAIGALYERGEIKYFDRESEGDLLVSMYNFKYPNTPDVRSPSEIRVQYLRKKYWQNYWRGYWRKFATSSGNIVSRTSQTGFGGVPTQFASLPRQLPSPSGPTSVSTPSSLPYHLVSPTELDFKVSRFMDGDAGKLRDFGRLDQSLRENPTAEYEDHTTCADSEHMTLSNTRVLHETDGQSTVCKWVGKDEHDKLMKKSASKWKENIQKDGKKGIFGGGGSSNSSSDSPASNKKSGKGKNGKNGKNIEAKENQNTQNAFVGKYDPPSFNEVVTKNKNKLLNSGRPVSHQSSGASIVGTLRSREKTSLRGRFSRSWFDRWRRNSGATSDLIGGSILDTASSSVL